MKILVKSIVGLCFFIYSQSNLFGQMLVQLPEQNGLLWEVTGNGLKKPSYIYGTMHVSSRLAFHLGDSFYHAIMNSDMVALEQNLDTVIDDWVTERSRRRNNNFSYTPGISLNTFDLEHIDKKTISKAISYDPHVLNSIMFRRDDYSGDFQQETYLDLYIYRLGKKMGKQIGGVEDYNEAKDLVKQAQKGSIKDRKLMKESDYYRFNNFDFADAYRKGNIKLIDSFERLTNGPNFAEYMLYVRNENMVRRIDSIMKLGISIFAGVGCAHLGAERGVINLLAKMGYTLRPVQSMATKISKISKKYDDMPYKLKYKETISPDSSFTCKLPGDWIVAQKGSTFNIFIYPELVNGYFYTVYKLKTNSSVFGDKPEDVLLTVDSSLFEAVPGKIIKQKNIVINGHKGYEIINKTSEGDYQKYYIIITALDAYVIKLGGKKDYVLKSDAKQFFNSIKFKTQKQQSFAQYQTPDNMVYFKMPSSANNNTTITYDDKVQANFRLIAYDEQSNTTYLTEQLRANSNLDDDTFELKLLLESFSNTDNFYITDGYKLSSYNGYPSIEGEMRGANNRFVKARVVSYNEKIVLMAAIYQGLPNINPNFFSSLSLKKPIYEKFITYYDSLAKYRVKVPELPIQDLEDGIGDDDEDDYFGYYSDEEDKGDSTKGNYSMKTFVPNGGAEVVNVLFFSKSKYQILDSLSILEIKKMRDTNRNFFIIDTTITVSGTKTIVNIVIGDTATNIVRFTKNIYNKGAIYEIYGSYNLKEGPSIFIKEFLNSFEILDTIWAEDPFKSSFDTFYADYFSKDSMNRARLIKKIGGRWYSEVDIVDADAPKLALFIKSFYIEKDFVLKKAKLIELLGTLKHPSVLESLKDIYKQAGDTITYKMSVLNAMCAQKSKESYSFVRDRLLDDLPIGAKNFDDLILYKMTDSLRLSPVFFPDLLELTYIDEVGNKPYFLLGELLDSNFISPAVYKQNLNRIYMDAWISFRRKLVKEETKDEKALGLKLKENAEEKWGSYNSYSYNSSADYLEIARLLLPYKNENPKYAKFFDDLNKIRTVSEKFEILKFFIKHNLPYSDTLIPYFAASKLYRLPMFTFLKSNRKENLFPKKYARNDSIIYAVIQGKFNSYYNKIDELSLIDSFNTIKGRILSKTLVYNIKRSSAEHNQLLFVSNVPLDSLCAPYKLKLALKSELKVEDEIEAQIAKEIRQYKLLAEKPNNYSYAISSYEYIDYYGDNADYADYSDYEEEDYEDYEE